ADEARPARPGCPSTPTASTLAILSALSAGRPRALAEPSGDCPSRSLDLRPLLDPDGVVHAVGRAVAAVRLRGLPQVDRLQEVDVAALAVAHRIDQAGVLAQGRPQRVTGLHIAPGGAVPQTDLRLDLRAHRVLHPLVHAVGVLGV